MIIICPSCTARYRLEATLTALPPTGRSMRCGRCGNRWQVQPIDPPEILLPARDDEEHIRRDGAASASARAANQAKLVDDSVDWNTEEDNGGGESDHGAASRPFRKHRRLSSSGGTRRTRKVRRWQAFLLGMLLALVGAGLHYREDVTRAMPASAGLFRSIGLPVNLRGLEFQDIETRRTFEDGVPVLIIEGQIVNLRAATSAVPAVRIAVRGSHGEELYHWTVEPRQSVLAADAAMPVRSRLALPPSGANDVELRFVERSAREAGLRQ